MILREPLWNCKELNDKNLSNCNIMNMTEAEEKRKGTSKRGLIVAEFEAVSRSFPYRQTTEAAPGIEPGYKSLARTRPTVGHAAMKWPRRDSNPHASKTSGYLTGICVYQFRHWAMLNGTGPLAPVLSRVLLP